LARDLEGEPLELGVLVQAGAGQFVVLVVLVDQVPQNREGLPGFRSVVGARRVDNEYLPDSEVVVVVVDYGGDATVGVDLQKFWTLLLFLAEIEVHRFVRQPEFFKNNGDFPKSQISRQASVSWGKAGTIYQPLGPPLWVYKVNCFP